MLRILREKNRQDEMKGLLAKGVVPRNHDLEQHPERLQESQMYAMGLVAALIREILPAKTIVENMVEEAAVILHQRTARIQLRSKL